MKKKCWSVIFVDWVMRSCHILSCILLPFWIRSWAADAFFCVPVFDVCSPSFFCCFSENNLIMLTKYSLAKFCWFNHVWKTTKTTTRKSNFNNDFANHEYLHCIDYALHSKLLFDSIVCVFFLINCFLFFFFCVDFSLSGATNNCIAPQQSLTIDLDAEWMMILYLFFFSLG